MYLCMRLDMENFFLRMKFYGGVCGVFDWLLIVVEIRGYYIWGFKKGFVGFW